MGIEHEYGLWRASSQVDFRTLLPAMTAGLRTLDPGDPRARRLPSGVVLTADGREAELATPPLPWQGSTPEMLDRLLAEERSVLALRAAEVAGVDRVTGFSTHVNVSVPDERVVEVGSRFVRHCGLATALVGEPGASSGLLVRPRRGRLEVGGEYAEGPHLVALTTFVGSAVAALLDDLAPPRVPEPVAVPARERFGWYLPPEGATANRELLEEVWTWARPACVRDGIDPEPVDRLVAGAPLRRDVDEATPQHCTVRQDQSESILSVRDTGPRLLAGGVEAETLWLTWQHVVWVFRSSGREVHAVIPVDQEADFLARLDAGEYDDVVRRELGRLAGRRLLVNAQLDGPGWWREVRPGALVPAERGPDGSVPRVSRRRAARQLASPVGG
jgi:hypothetical protein